MARETPSRDRAPSHLSGSTKAFARCQSDSSELSERARCRTIAAKLSRQRRAAGVAPTLLASQSRRCCSSPCHAGKEPAGSLSASRPNQDVHDVSETRDLLPFASQRLFGEEDRGNIGVRFDPSTFRHPSTGSGTRLKASQAQDTAGSTNLGTGRSLNFSEGFVSGGHGIRVGGISRIVLYGSPFS